MTCGPRLIWARAGRKGSSEPLCLDYRIRPAAGFGGRLGPACPEPQAGAQALAPCLHSRVCPRREGGTGAVLGLPEQRRSPGRLDEVARQGWGAAGRPLGWGPAPSCEQWVGRQCQGAPLRACAPGSPLCLLVFCLFLSLSTQFLSPVCVNGRFRRGVGSSRGPGGFRREGSQLGMLSAPVAHGCLRLKSSVCPRDLHPPVCPPAAP